MSTRPAVLPRRPRACRLPPELALGRHRDVVERRRVQAQDLLLAGRVDAREVGVLLAVGVVPVHEALDLPLRFPDAVVAAEGHLVLADPEQQLAHHLREEPGARVHETADDHRQAGVDVGFLGRHEAEVLDARQPDVLDDEVQRREVGSRVIDVGDVERVLVQRPDRRPLVHVDVLDAQFLAPLQVPVRLRVGQLPAARALPPLGGVELDTLATPPGDVVSQRLEAGVSLAGVPTGVQDEPARVLLGQQRVALGGVEALLVPLLEVGGLHDPHVDVAGLEQVVNGVLLGVLHVLLQRPPGVLRPEAVVGVEALDPALGELLGTGHPVVRRGVPVVHVRVDHEVLLAVLLVHGSALPPLCDMTPRRPRTCGLNLRHRRGTRPGSVRDLR